MDINKRVATLDLIFQELKDSHPMSMYISNTKYKLTHDELMHIEAMLSETGLVDVIDERYAATQFTLNSKGVNELMKYGSYSTFLASLKPALYQTAATIDKRKSIFHNLGSLIASKIWEIIIALLVGFLIYKFGWN